METIQLDKTKRIVIQKQLRRDGHWGYFNFIEEKILWMWIGGTLLNEGWDSIHGYHSLESAREKAEEWKERYLET